VDQVAGCTPVEQNVRRLEDGIGDESKV